MYSQLSIRSNGDGTTTVSGPCVYTKKLYSITIDELGFEKYRCGEIIQRALPKVSREDREFLISGASPEGWTLKFGSDE